MFLQAFQEIFYSGGLQDTFGSIGLMVPGMQTRSEPGEGAGSSPMSPWGCGGCSTACTVSPKSQGAGRPRGVAQSPPDSLKPCHTEATLLHLLYLLLQSTWQSFGILRAYLNISNSSLLFDYSGLVKQPHSVLVLVMV